MPNQSPINQVEHIIANHSKKLESLIPILQDIQAMRGYLPKEDLEQVSRQTGISMNRIYGVATFYSQFSLTPKGKYIVSVCTGTACHVKGSDKLVKHLENKLGIKSGEVTKDMKFALEDVRCIGACSLAPAVMINEKVYGKMIPEKIDEVLAELA